MLPHFPLLSHMWCVPVHPRTCWPYSKSRVNAEVLLNFKEAVSHDSAMKYLADSRTFVVDHCLVVDRPWADETITVSVEKRMGGGRGEGRGVGKSERWEVRRKDREKRGEGRSVHVYICACVHGLGDSK